MSNDSLNEESRIRAPEWKPGCLGVAAITVHLRTGEMECLKRADDERYILIDPLNVGPSGIWGIWTSRAFHTMNWSRIDRIEIEHLSPTVAA